MKNPVVDPAATVTAAGTDATAGLPLASDTDAPPAGAAAERVTVPCELDPPVTLAGLTAALRSVAGSGVDGVTVSVVVLVEPLYVAVITTVVVAATAVVAIWKTPAKPFSAIVTVAGTDATSGALLESETSAPPNGAPTLSTTVPDEPVPPTTVDGWVDIVESVAGGGAACGVKLRTADHAPGVPAMLIPRARQKWVTASSPPVAYEDEDRKSTRLN